MLEFTVSSFNLYKSYKSFFLFFNVVKLQIICCDLDSLVASREDINRMDKSKNLNPAGNTESFGISVNATLLVKIVEGSIKLSHLSKLD